MDVLIFIIFIVVVLISGNLSFQFYILHVPNKQIDKLQKNTLNSFSFHFISSKTESFNALLQFLGRRKAVLMYSVMQKYPDNDKWKKFVRVKLNVSEYNIEKHCKNHPRNVEEQRYRMFRTWMKQETLGESLLDEIASNLLQNSSKII